MLETYLYKMHIYLIKFALKYVAGVARNALNCFSICVNGNNWVCNDVILWCASGLHGYTNLVTVKLMGFYNGNWSLILSLEFAKKLSLDNTNSTTPLKLCVHSCFILKLTCQCAESISYSHQNCHFLLLGSTIFRCTWQFCNCYTVVPMATALLGVML